MNHNFFFLRIQVIFRVTRVWAWQGSSVLLVSSSACCIMATTAHTWKSKIEIPNPIFMVAFMLCSLECRRSILWYVWGTSPITVVETSPSPTFRINVILTAAYVDVCPPSFLKKNLHSHVLHIHWSNQQGDKYSHKSKDRNLFSEKLSLQEDTRIGSFIPAILYNRKVLNLDLMSFVKH